MGPFETNKNPPGRWYHSDEILVDESGCIIRAQQMKVEKSTIIVNKHLTADANTT